MKEAPDALVGGEAGRGGTGAAALQGGLCCTGFVVGAAASTPPAPLRYACRDGSIMLSALSTKRDLPTTSKCLA